MRKDFFGREHSKAQDIESSRTEPELTALLKSHKLSSEEYQRIKTAIGRAPSYSEVGVFSAMWSEHCSYKSSRIHLKRFPTKGPAVVVGPGENAGIVRLKDKTCIAFKMESHNHPSFIEPYQGAATGVGGILRDVFCMGARPIANLNCLRYGRKDANRMKTLVANSIKGIGDYGNCVGIPTVGGNISFDPAYNGNILINAMSVGAIHEDEIFKGYASGSGNYVVYVGSSTGRDGVHGATMASDSFSSTSGGSRTTVQVGDPFAEKLLLEVTLELLKKNLVVGLQDMGAAGLTSSSFEMASRAGSGLFIDLGQIPVRASNLAAYEMLLSESQERMLLVVTPKNWPAVRQIVEHWELSYAIIGEVTETGRVEIVHNGCVEVDLPVGPVVDDAPLYDRPRKPVVIPRNEDSSKFTLGDDPVAHLIKILELTGSKSWIYEQYDQDIGANTRFNSRHGGAAVVAVRPDWDPNSRAAIAISTACNERYCSVDSFLGAAHSVVKCARMISAAGGRPLAITDCLNFGSATDPVVMQQISDAVDGISEACRRLEVPVISGNVSLYNETDGKHIHPTPMIGMVGSLDDYTASKPAVVPVGSGRIYLIHPKNIRPSLNVSISRKILDPQGLSEASVLSLDYFAEIESMAFVRGMSVSKEVFAIRDIGDGGIITAIAKMSRNSNLGLEVRSPFEKEGLGWQESFFGEFPGCYIVAASNDWQFVDDLEHNQVAEIGTFSSTSSEFRFGKFATPKTRIYQAFDQSMQFVEQ